MFLLVGSGLLLTQFFAAAGSSAGFSARSSSRRRHPPFADDLCQAGRSLPVFRPPRRARQNAFRAFAPPLRLPFLPVSGGGSIIHFNITGRPPKSPREFVAAGYRTITPRYLETLGVPLLQGRHFTHADNEKSPPVVVINASMVHTFFPNENPLGKRLQLGALPEQAGADHGNRRRRRRCSSRPRARSAGRNVFALSPGRFDSAGLPAFPRHADGGRSCRSKPPPSAARSRKSTRISRSSRSAPWKTTWPRRLPSRVFALGSSASSPCWRWSSPLSASTA